MKIGVIGTGNIGKLIIRKMAKAGFIIKIANSRGPETLKDFAEEVGVKAVPTLNVVEEVDVVILAIPTKDVPNLPKNLFQRVKAGTLVVDVTNYYPYRDGQIKALDDGMIESEWISKHINYPVVKALNSIIFLSFDRNGRPSGTKGRIALPISGDDVKSKEVIAKIIDSIGYDSMDVGSIAESWRQQPGTPVYCTDPTKEDLMYWIQKCKRDVLSQNREEIVKKYFAWPEDTPLEVMLKELRVLLQTE
ncbi:NADPH-dependent F420 reductase [Leptospira sp. 'Mane']|uniref:NADPH-dependent F420 reductase n=1 Tax=Leptospira sp. 'Mane' TaxID=3387407 RepID=UPI00398ACFF4